MIENGLSLLKALDEAGEQGLGYLTIKEKLPEISDELLMELEEKLCVQVALGVPQYRITRFGLMFLASRGIKTKTTKKDQWVKG